MCIPYYFQHCILLTTTCSAKRMRRLKRNLLNSESSVRQYFFRAALPEEIKLLLPLTSFIHSLNFSIHLLQPDFLIYIFLWYWQKGIKKRRFSAKQSQAKVSALCHMALSISSHLAAQGVTVKHDSSSYPITHAINVLTFSFSPLKVKCAAAG